MAFATTSNALPTTATYAAFDTYAAATQPHKWAILSCATTYVHAHATAYELHNKSSIPTVYNAYATKLHHGLHATYSTTNAGTAAATKFHIFTKCLQCNVICNCTQQS